MFEGDYTINGKHATYIKYLVNDVKAFDRYIDVYMTGAALGALNDKRAKQDGSTDRARIYSDAFNTEHVKYPLLLHHIPFSTLDVVTGLHLSPTVCSQLRCVDHTLPYMHNPPYHLYLPLHYLKSSHTTVQFLPLRIH